MNNTEILKNAPDGCTHIFEDHEYNPTYAKRYEDSLKYFWFHPTHGNWYEAYTMPQQDIRSRADIEALVAKNKRIAELEANQAKRDLNKIKADAIREAVKLYKNKVFDGCDIYSDGLLDYADKLEQRK